MDRNLTIKEKILSFLESQGIRKAEFFEAAGIQSSNFKGKNMQSQPGGDMIVKVLTLYPQLSAEWLLRGKGEMLINNESGQTTDQAQQQVQEPPMQIMDKLLTTIQEQAQELGKYKEIVRLHMIEHEKSAARANTSTIANAGWYAGTSYKHATHRI